MEQPKHRHDNSYQISATHDVNRLCGHQTHLVKVSV